MIVWRLEGNYQVCSVQYCVRQLRTTVVCWLALAFMWLHCVLEFICVRLCCLGLFCAIVYLCMCAFVC